MPKVMHPPIALDLLLATREASRSAHRWRDRASDRYTNRPGMSATAASREKTHWYSLKDRGIAALFAEGLLRYAGSTAQSLAVYEDGMGDRDCLHSTLHPVGHPRTQVPNHPEVLQVASRKQGRIRLIDVEHTLSALPIPSPLSSNGRPNPGPAAQPFIVMSVARKVTSHATVRINGCRMTAFARVRG